MIQSIQSAVKRQKLPSSLLLQRVEVHDAVLAGAPHPEEPEDSLQDVGPRLVLRRQQRGRVRDGAREARLHEGDVPDGGGLEEVLGHPGLRVDEVDALGVLGVRVRRQELRVFACVLG